MDERFKELIAIGASAAVNCQPCLRHHLGECDRLGIGRDEAAAAAEVGMMVNRGAASRTRSHVRELLGGTDESAGGQGGCGCG
jgi:AhpD family alkylhydroperoxidase